MPEQNPFTYAITRRPGRSLVDGITTAELGRPDYEKALAQHQRYVQALESCGLEVTVMEADERHPDSVFVEDPAVLTPRCAVITNPGAKTRKKETKAIRKAVAQFYDSLVIKTIKHPGTLEGGDVMQVGSHFYIGISGRTNRAGARQLTDILTACGMTSSMIEAGDLLHLKTGMSYLSHNHLLAIPALASLPELQKFDILTVVPGEAYAANCLWINDTVIVPEGFSKTRRAIEQAGYATIAVDMSEFQKVDGGLSCLSLRI